VQYGLAILIESLLEKRQIASNLIKFLKKLIAPFLDIGANIDVKNRFLIGFLTTLKYPLHNLDFSLTNALYLKELTGSATN
jgi:hypothetical protein